MESNVNHKTMLLNLSNVWFVPEIKNLFMVLMAPDQQRNGKLKSSATNCIFNEKEKIVLNGVLEQYYSKNTERKLN